MRTQHREQLQNLRREQRDQARQRRVGKREALQQRRLERQGSRANLARAQAVENNRFAARYRDRDGWRDREQWRYRHLPPRHAWRYGRRPVFVAWIGPLFYPYAYADIFEYTFWPSAYDDGYWAYMYDDFFDGVFWGRGNPYYADTGVIASLPGSPPASRRITRGGSQTSAQVAQLCRTPGEGVTAWPIARIEQAVKPNETQKALLEDLKRAAGEAATAFKEACIEEVPLTPPGRLAAMTRRIEATLEAVRIVRPALDAFYNALDDEQKARFNMIGPERLDAEETARTPQDNDEKQAEACPDVKPGLVDLPLAEIEETLKPNEAQRTELDKLRQAMTSAAEQLQAACPGTVALTPAGRLEAMEKRLDAMVQAGKTLQPTLSDFYAALDSEQKARFNTLGRQARVTP